MSSSPSPRPKNYSLSSIAGVYALGLIPHGYYFAKMMFASNFQATNVLPRSNLPDLKGRISDAAWQSLAKARGTHLNALEAFPLFAAAMIAGNVAKMPVEELNTMAAKFIGARVLYTALYMGVKSEAASYLRTGVWAWGISIPIMGLIKAGRRMAEAEVWMVGG